MDRKPHSLYMTIPSCRKPIHEHTHNNIRKKPMQLRQMKSSFAEKLLKDEMCDTTNDASSTIVQ